MSARFALAPLVACLLSAAPLAQPGAFRLGGATQEVGRAVDVDSDGAVALGGTYFNAFDADPGPGTTALPSARLENSFVAVYEASGALRFAVPLVSVGQDAVFDVAFTSTGDVAVLGQAGSQLDLDPGADETFVDGNGVTVYLAVYTPTGAFRYGVALSGLLFNQGAALATDGSGNVYVAGTLDGSIDLDPGTGNVTVTGSDDPVLVSYDADGGYRFGFALGPGTGYVRGLDVAGDRVALAVTLSGTLDVDPGAAVQEIESTGSLDILVATYTTDGALTSAFAIGTNGADTIRDVAIDGSGRLLVVGQIQSPTDVDPGPGVVTVGTDGGVALGAYLLVSYNADLSVRYATNLGSVVPTGVALRNGVAVYSANAPTGAFDADPSAGTTTITTTDGFDGLIVSLDGSGALRWANTVVGAGGGDNALAVAYASDGSVVATGRFARSVTLADGQGLTSAGSDDIFVTSYAPNGTLNAGPATDADDAPNGSAPSLTVWPNPSRGTVWVRTEALTGTVRIDVLDALGRQVAVVHEGALTDAVVLPPLAPGIYTVRAASGTVTVTTRAIVVR